ncbi:hypothetical protein RRG08_016137 [Elysia crispata]|uniref:Uncharacterized protein n=1 Tax=Elysia crispata TaxID=231223 RepID=A0AAE0Z2X8_9GAST|nr:hypothetical protein RRG08_016137 [Elysia crispata]
MLVAAALAISKGNPVDMCDYPGIAAVVSGDKNVVLCSGVTQAGNVLLIPELCRIAVTKQLTVSDVIIKYGNGDNTITLTKDSVAAGPLTDGVWRLQLPTPLDGDCKDPPPAYDSSSMTLDLDSCEMVGFGAETLSSQVYDKSGAKAAPITKCTSTSCCDVIRPTIPEIVTYIVDDSAPLNCLTSSGAACSVADVGAPIFCNTKSGQKVAIGLTGSAPCAPGETFVVHDLTSGDPKWGDHQLPSGLISPTPFWSHLTNSILVLSHQLHSSLISPTPFWFHLTNSLLVSSHQLPSSLISPTPFWFHLTNSLLVSSHQLPSSLTSPTPFWSHLGRTREEKSVLLSVPE